MSSSAPAPEEGGIKIISVNRRARHDYEFLETFEAGLALKGSEIKTLRQGKVAFKDGYVEFREGEAWLVGVHIPEYDHRGFVTHDPERPRKLLLHAREITSLASKVAQKGLTVIPVKLYLKRGRAKLEIALARGRKTFDRRDELKARDIERDTKRQLARY